MEIVLSTREQIESRNPLAFAPKVIRTSEPGQEFLGVKAFLHIFLPFSFTITHYHSSNIVGVF